MRRRTLLIAVVCLLAAGIVPASYAQGSCQTVQFSSDLLQRFPNIRKACLDVISRDGQEWAVVKADLTRTSPDAVWVKTKQPDGTHSEAHKINVKPNFRVLVNGKPVSVEDLPVGQELTAYVKVSEPVEALAPADEREPLMPTPLEASPPQTAQNVQMPHTASALPAYGIIGAALLLAAAALSWLRMRMQP
jgi:hypothetical protein